MVHKLTIPSQIRSILVWQWLVTFCITAVLFVVKREVALSAFLGGLVCVLPNMYFARQLFTKRRTAVAAELLRRVYVAEFIKLGLAIALLAVVLINYKEVHPVGLFATYLITHSCMWAVPLLKQQNNKSKPKSTEDKLSKKTLNQTL